MFHATARSNLGYQLFQPYLRRQFARIAVPIAVSEPARAFVARYFPGAYHLLPNGVDLERFAPRPPRRDGRPTILALGRLDPRKGLEHLIDAVPALEQALGPVRLIIAGDGPRADSLRRRARAGSIEFLGPVARERTPDLYAAADCLCAPATRNESFGIVLLEAMASARPVVATDLSGYRRVVAAGETGWLVPPGDPEALAQALASVLVDPDAARAMGHAGRERARAYSWPRVSERLVTLYERALRPAPSPVAALEPAAVG
jgi:phosphatidylinositol alpha-mannosyltransferase